LKIQSWPKAWHDLRTSVHVGRRNIIKIHMYIYVCTTSWTGHADDRVIHLALRTGVYYAHHNSPRVLLNLHISLSKPTHEVLSAAAPLAPKCQLRSSSATHVKMSAFILGVNPPP
jgi:hypothetical protein